MSDTVTISREEYERMVKDSARLDWLESRTGLVCIGGRWYEDERKSAIVDVTYMESDDGFVAETVRSAIDSALQK